MLADTNNNILLEDGNKDDIIMKKIDKFFKEVWTRHKKKFEKDYIRNLN